MCAVNLTNDSPSKRHQVIKVMNMFRSCFWVLDKLQYLIIQAYTKSIQFDLLFHTISFFFRMKVRVEWMKMYLSLCVLFAVSVMA